MPEMSRIEQTFCRSVPWSAFTRSVLLPWALQGEQLAGDVLEIGGGGGAMAAGLLDRFPGIALTTTDPDPAMVHAADSRLAPYGARADARQADATGLEFPDSCFDAVVSFIMLHHVIEWEKAVSEAWRVLRPGGVLIGYDLLDNVVSRVIHVVDGSRNRLMQLGPLEQAFAELGATATLRPVGGRLAVRFRARRPRSRPVVDGRG